MKKEYQILIIICLISTACFCLKAQIDIGGKIRDEIQDRTEQHVDEAIDKAFDTVEEGIEESVTKEEEETQNDRIVNSNEEEQPANSANSQQHAKEATTNPALAAYSKYDFIPGEKVVLFEDFSQDNIGEFPALWNTNATGEVMTTNLYPGKWFKPMGDGVFLIERSIDLPQNFTLEFDVIPQYKEGAGSCDFYINIYDQPEMILNTDIYPGTGGFNINLSDNEHTFSSYSDHMDESAWISGQSYTGLLIPDELNKVKIWGQNQRIRMYIAEKKVFDLPRGILQGHQYNRFRISTMNRGGEPLISNIRIATGRPDVRSKLLTEGKWVTYGIYFDSGKDIVKPESYATLKEIATLLNENGDVRVKIVGHTDSDGDDSFNLDLSKRRALSVKNSLIKDFGLNASRIETDGKGESEPIYSNSTIEGKAGNRRVEIIKL